MAQTTIEQFATDLKMPPGALLEQLSAAAVAGKKQGDKLTEQDKTRLLEHLRKQHGAAAEAGGGAAAAAAKAAPGKASEGTLDRPAAKPGEKREKPAKKAPGQVFQEEAARRRALRLRGDVTGGAAVA